MIHHSELNIHELLKIHGIRPTKKKGQHFLQSKEIVEDIVDAASIEGRDTVLEIGVGPGILTFNLAELAGNVIAIELEPVFVNYLRREAKERGLSNLTVLQGDVLSMDLPAFDIVVSNLPYHISTPLIFKLLPLDFRNGVLMFQKEFGLRLIAPTRTKKRGAPTLKAHFYADIEGLFEVPRTAFFPEPEVDSIVLGLKRRPFPFELRNRDFYMKLIDVLFIHRRRKIRNSLLMGASRLSGTSGLSKEQWKDTILKNLKGDYLDRRPEELEFREMADLANQLHELLFDEAK